MALIDHSFSVGSRFLPTRGTRDEDWQMERAFMRGGPVLSFAGCSFGPSFHLLVVDGGKRQNRTISAKVMKGDVAHNANNDA
jgi:hypothetical protein